MLRSALIRRLRAPWGLGLSDDGTVDLLYRVRAGKLRALCERLASPAPATRGGTAGKRGRRDREMALLSLGVGDSPPRRNPDPCNRDERLLCSGSWGLRGCRQIACSKMVGQLPHITRDARRRSQFSPLRERLVILSRARAVADPHRKLHLGR